MIQLDYSLRERQSSDISFRIQCKLLRHHSLHFNVIIIMNPISTCPHLKSGIHLAFAPYVESGFGEMPVRDEKVNTARGPGFNLVADSAAPTVMTSRGRVSWSTTTRTTFSSSTLRRLTSKITHHLTFR